MERSRFAGDYQPSQKYKPPTDKEVLDTHVYRHNGSWHRRTFIRGHFEELGKLHQGWSGAETIIDEPIVRAARVFEVKPKE